MCNVNKYVTFGITEKSVIARSLKSALCEFTEILLGKDGKPDHDFKQYTVGLKSMTSFSYRLFYLANMPHFPEREQICQCQSNRQHHQGFELV